MTKEELLKRMLKDPLHFSPADMSVLLESGLEFVDLRECMRRIYDLNERQLEEGSNANNGALGVMNRYSSTKRRKAFFKKVETQKDGNNYVRIYAEGDSWFQFPVFVKDIIDWLSEREEYLIYSEAYGGDWITNIIYEGQYVPALSKIRPDVFLISGGGNDLVGSERVAHMVKKSDNPDCKKYTKEELDKISDKEIRDRISYAQKFVTLDFFAFLKVMEAQYHLLFRNIYNNTDKYKDLICITQGYDYPHPGKRRSFSLRYPLQPAVNWLVENGCWLYRPLMLRGFTKPEEQRAITTLFIYEFNEMLISVVENFPQVYHVDCRGFAKEQADWFDELHLKSHKYKSIADVYAEIISSTRKEKTLSTKIFTIR